MSRFNVFSSENGNPLARRDVQTIWGTHFVQANTCGLASYHFAADGSGAWIEYNHDLIPSTWRLDNGQVPPRRKDFSEFSYDPLQRVFKGCINWTPFAFSGHDKWVYCMEFNEKFSGIVGGFIKAYRPDGALGEEMTFGPDLAYRRVRESIFDATYVQSTVLSSLLPDVEAMVGKASYHFTRDGCWISYASAPETWKLDSGARIPLKKNFQNISYDHDARIFRGVIDWSDDPIANATRWEYEMHFDPSFRTLREGTVRTVDVNGTSEIRRFGVDMSYVLHDEADAPCCT
ncbi:Hypothetical Protein FCC1311_064052 [Hondaea fermentalgiana]|uniref:Uncharacterized protein n=1 Tax=Hondaea fermentalgiana TaxID=2315210 RepID=A0A2R5GHW8_9STRA|nr:Hypothetical Protein FCC1311_064052 [Hondaea fermentalgiana]|eukprot:GBG30185.1 Hypothetical Protein FCC1311_064052 [Hondaea fermentalgiana]